MEISPQSLHFYCSRIGKAQICVNHLKYHTHKRKFLEKNFTNYLNERHTMCYTQEVQGKVGNVVKEIGVEWVYSSIVTMSTHLNERNGR